MHSFLLQLKPSLLKIDDRQLTIAQRKAIRRPLPFGIALIKLFIYFRCVTPKQT